MPVGTPAPEAPRAIHWAGTASLGIIWGTSFMGMAIALDGFTPLWVATGRLAIGGLTLLLLERLFAVIAQPAGHPGAGVSGWAARGLRRVRPAGAAPWRFVLLLGVFTAALPFVLLTWGLQTVPSAFAGVSMAAVPLFVLPLAHVFVPGERLTPHRSLGVVTGFFGVLILIGPATLVAGNGDGLLPGRLACVAAALSYAIASVLTRRCPPVDAIWLARSMTLTGAMLLLPIALWQDGWPETLPLLPTLTLLGIGILPTGIANLLRVLIVRSVGPGFMSLTAYQVPVWSVIFGALVLAEPIPTRMVAALAMILAGIALVQRRA